MNSGESVMVSTHCQLVRIYNYLGEEHLFLPTEDYIPHINLHGKTNLFSTEKDTRTESLGPHSQLCHQLHTCYVSKVPERRG